VTRIGRFAKASLEKRHLPAFLEACEGLARGRQWAILAPLASELIEEIGTADATRIAVLATFNEGHYEECLEIFGRTEPLFPGRKLSADLRRLRVQALKRLVRSLEAIELAEQAAREEQAPEDVLNLVNPYWAKGDLPVAAFYARALRAQPSLPPEEGLRTAVRIASADPEVARDLFRKAVQAGVLNELLPASIYVVVEPATV
jgi:tetratricopeptide (TPR) repeat protein